MPVRGWNILVVSFVSSLVMAFQRHVCWFGCCRVLTWCAHLFEFQGVEALNCISN